MQDACHHPGAEEVVSAGYYDGTFAGIVRCDACVTTFWVVAQACEAAMGYRLFSWVPIAESAVPAIDALFTASLQVEIEDDEQEAEQDRALNERLHELLGEARPSYWTIGSRLASAVFVGVGAHGFDDVIVPYRGIASSTLIAVDDVRRHLEQRGVTFAEVTTSRS